MPPINIFSFQGEFYEKINGVVMGFPLSPIVSSLFMENFEKRVMDAYPPKETTWKGYIDVTNVMWLHGRQEINKFF
jgi:hypothetical protein